MTTDIGFPDPVIEHSKHGVPLTHELRELSS